MKTIAIMGGGISGLTAAYLLAKRGNCEVHVIERTASLGGLLKSFDYGEYGRFDYGAHNILETGIEELDQFFINLLPSDKWQATTTINGQLRALTGLVYNQKLQQNSPFIDLRGHPKLAEYIGDFFLNITNQPQVFENKTNQDCYSFSLYLFGKKITDDIICPALEKLYKRHPSELNTMAMYISQFTRIGLFEETVMQELVHLKKIGARLSYTEQMNLPTEYLVHLRSLYPRDYGIYRVIEAIENRLNEMGVIFHMQASLSNINYQNDLISDITINKEKLNIDQLVCSTGYPSISNLLKIDTSQYQYDKPPKTVITNLLIDKPLNCGELSFIYSYDKDSIIFRIDNYINYCTGAKRNNYYPISVETLDFGPEQADSILQSRIVDELYQYKIIQADTQIGFIKTEKLDNGFPLLTQNNVQIMDDLRMKVKNLQLSNLTNIGILSEQGIFFESDVIKNTYQKIMEII